MQKEFGYVLKYYMYMVEESYIGLSRLKGVNFRICQRLTPFILNIIVVSFYN